MSAPSLSLGLDATEQAVLATYRALGGSRGGGGDRNIAAVDFPPRNEPLAFRRDLDSYYQNTLRRGAISTFVDIEGTIVWTQEYLRYRLSGCSHTDATARVQTQIVGLGGIQPDCGSIAPFPPRNEPLAFRQSLETLYRDGLRRGPSTTFVDTEGDIVWTQEYLRYRVGGCLHAVAQGYVINQIAGLGIAPICSAPPPTTTTIPPTPPPPQGFSRSGVGDSVFDIPRTVTRLRIIGTYNGFCQNFAVRVNGRLLVNEILGSCSVATVGRRYEGTHLLSPGGGVAEVVISSGVTWEFFQVN